MNINQNIPGWNGFEILEQLAKFAAEVPENGAILELGALFGRSTYALGWNKQVNVALHVIDCWDTIYLSDHEGKYIHDNKGGEIEKQMIIDRFKSDPNRLDSADYYNLWKEWTSGISNLFSYKNHTSIDNKNFPMMDLIFHDAGHSYEDVYNDLVHWFPKLKSNGLIIVDDYDRIDFSDLCSAVDRFIEENNLSCEMITSRNILLRRAV